MQYTDKEILDHLEASSESFIKIDKYFDHSGVSYYNIRVCSKQLEAPSAGLTVREALTRMIDDSK